MTKLTTVRVGLKSDKKSESLSFLIVLPYLTPLFYRSGGDFPTSADALMLHGHSYPS